MANLTKDCHLVFDEAVFSGHWRNASFEGYRTISGTIVKESYGPKTGHHFFTILLDNCEGAESHKYKSGQKIRRRGKNIYPLISSITYPKNHTELAAEKSRRKIDAQLWRDIDQ